MYFVGCGLTAIRVVISDIMINANIFDRTSRIFFRVEYVESDDSNI